MFTPQDLVHVRKTLHLSQKQLAKVLGVDAHLVKRWEKGEEKPPAHLGLMMTRSVRRTRRQGQLVSASTSRLLRTLAIGGLIISTTAGIRAFLSFLFSGRKH
jgi:DNA-binding XRE family transcriptional regulator